MLDLDGDKNGMENKRKRIGVIGYWFATNYGGVASYFSLYNNLREWGYLVVRRKLDMNFDYLFRSSYMPV